MDQIVAVVSVVVGCLTCFLGYRLFKVLLAVWGFAVGALVSWRLALDATGYELAAFAAAVIGGFILSALAEMLYFFGVFLAGAGLGVILAGGVSAVFGTTLHPVALLLIASLSGAVALSFQKAVIIWSTALNGAWHAVLGVAVLQRHAGRVQMVPAQEMVNGRLLAQWVLVALAGVFVQYAFTSKGVRHRPPRDGR